MQRRQDGKNERIAFQSLAELGEYIETTRAKWSFRSSEKYRGDVTWDLGADYKEAVRMARHGWLEGAEKAQEALKAFMPMTPEPDTKVDFYGYRPHVPRYCAGDPMNMVRRDPIDPQYGSGKVLTLGVPVNAVSSVSAQSMANFGVAVAQYVNQLETEGTRVELIGMSVSEVSGWRVAQTWVIKGAEQPLDLAVVAFSIGHPAMFRRLGFALLERCAAPETATYGHTKAAEVSDIINAAPGTFILNGMKNADQYAPTPAKALEYVTQQIEKAMEAQYADQ
jgi:hypothetical protein